MEIESEQDTDVRSGGRPDSAFSADSFRNAGTPFISDDDDHDAMRDDANLLHTDDLAGNTVNVVVRQEERNHNDGVEPSKFRSVKWIIIAMYIFFLLVIAIVVLGVGLLYIVDTRPRNSNYKCFQQVQGADNDILVDVEQNMTTTWLWLYELNVSFEKDCTRQNTSIAIGYCQDRNCPSAHSTSYTISFGINNSIPILFSPTDLFQPTCFSFQNNLDTSDCMNYTVTFQYSYNKRLDFLLFWSGITIVFVIIALIVVSSFHLVWFKIKNKRRYILFEVEE